MQIWSSQDDFTKHWLQLCLVKAIIDWANISFLDFVKLMAFVTIHIHFIWWMISKSKTDRNIFFHVLSYW